MPGPLVRHMDAYAITGDRHGMGLQAEPYKKRARNVIGEHGQKGDVRPMNGQSRSC